MPRTTGTAEPVQLSAGRNLAPESGLQRPEFGPQAGVSASLARRPMAAVLADLFKARLNSLVLLTSGAAFYLGSGAQVNRWLLVRLLLGTGLLAAGASALNQLFERSFDALMSRTAARPLPSGEVKPHTVLWLGWVLSAVGLAELAVGVNLLTSLLGAVTFVLYLGVYTPLKRLTWTNTFVGAISGALPPLMGWTAARGVISIEGLTLFTLQVFWQVPHFMAIAWMYRQDYVRAGYRMLPASDPNGRRTALQALLFTLGLLPLSAYPYFLQLAGRVYLVSSLALSTAFICFALQFFRDTNLANAKRLFRLSLVYLPLLFGVLLANRQR